MYAFTSKVYRRLNDPEFTIQFFKSKQFAGVCYLGEKFIKISATDQILSTLIHEMVHDIYPGWTEEQVEGRERLIMNRLSYRQLINLTGALHKSLSRSHKKANRRV